jgi:hypothetical protein
MHFLAERSKRSAPAASSEPATPFRSASVPEEGRVLQARRHSLVVDCHAGPHGNLRLTAIW